MAALSLVSAWTGARRRLQAAGLEGPVIDARLLVEAVAGATRADILADPHRPLTVAQVEALEGLLQRRLAREPVSHILGRRAFWNVTLAVTPDVLAPRPETETILDVVLPRFDPQRPFRVLDLGVGSGALLLAILAERPRATGVGVDASAAALAVAAANASELGLAGRASLRLGDWTAGLETDGFDLVVSNPPYIPSADITHLAPEVRDHEPHLALDGGADGLAAYRALAAGAVRVLRPGGDLAVEIGPGQQSPVEALFRAAGAVDVATADDLAGRARVVFGSKKDVGDPRLTG